MKILRSVTVKALVVLAAFTILCGILYPLAVTGISQLLFHDKANGSIIEVDGVKYGCEFLGQEFTGKEYMWGRIMSTNTETFTDEKGNATIYAGPSNKSPASQDYEKQVKERIAMIQKANPDAKEEAIPVDLVTNSGSGLDPHISTAAAKYQVPRIAKERDMQEKEVEKIIDKYTTGRFLGIFGENTVNVLDVNLALDGILK